ncbi:hypothetical protein LCGC14_3098780, partial [marine sediment metagenome]
VKALASIGGGPRHSPDDGFPIRDSPLTPRGLPRIFLVCLKPF